MKTLLEDVKLIDLKNDLKVESTENKLKKLLISNSNHATIIDLQNIKYIKSSGCYSLIYLNDDSYLTSSKPISYYEKTLLKYNFYRIHQKYILNLDYVKKIISGYPVKVMLKNDEIINVTRLNKIDLMKMFIY